MGKNPAFQFYPADWQRDLSEHPLEIEGAWIRICCALWWSETPGSATKPLTNWSRILRVGEKKSLSIITYLLNQKIAEVVIQDSTITITSRRMVKDEHIRNIRRCAGSKGGNPALVSKPNKDDLLNQNLLNQKSTPSSSSSSSSSKKKIITTWPDSFVLTDHLRKLASKYIPMDMIDTEWEAFRAYSISNNKQYADWDAAWTTRYINYAKYNKTNTATIKPNKEDDLLKEF